MGSGVVDALAVLPGHTVGALSQGRATHDENRELSHVWRLMMFVNKTVSPTLTVFLAALLALSFVMFASPEQAQAQDDKVYTLSLQTVAPARTPWARQLKRCLLYTSDAADE